MGRRIDGRRAGRRARGQALVEFALVFPLFMLMTLFIIEFAFVFSAVLGINFASRNAALTAAEAGDDVLADCVILQDVEKSIGAPGNTANIQTVMIYRSDQGGSARLQSLTYTRGGSTTCTKGVVSLTVPYSSCNGAVIDGTLEVGRCPATAYTYSNRCNILAGCSSLNPARTQIDTIGVEIAYFHYWVTPMRNFGFTGPYATLTQSNAMRMEPIL